MKQFFQNVADATKAKLQDVANTAKAKKESIKAHIADVRAAQDSFNQDMDALVAEHGLVAVDRATKKATIGGRISLAAESLSAKFEAAVIGGATATVNMVGTGLGKAMLAFANATVRVFDAIDIRKLDPKTFGQPRSEKSQPQNPQL